MRRFHLLALFTVLVTVGLGPVAARADDTSELIRDAKETVAMLQRTDPGLATFLKRSAGYAVFPTVGKGAVGVGGAHGTGVLFDSTGRPLGKATLSQVTV